MGPENVVTIDCQYMTPGRAAAYLIHSAGEAAFIDNNTRHAVPHLLGALDAQAIKPEQVRYLILTHIHLDHAGGTGPLLDACPNAQVIVHPRGARHLAAPGRLVAGAKSVYGENLFQQLYGQILPIDIKRIRTAADNESVLLGERRLTFLHVRGHANHHIAILDSGSNGLFTGDAFGAALRLPGEEDRPILAYSASPPEFDLEAARESVLRMMGLRPDWVFITHFGPVDRVQQAGRQLLESLNAFEAVMAEAKAAGLPEQDLPAFCMERLRQRVRARLNHAGARLSDRDYAALEEDLTLSAKGLAVAVMMEK